MFLQMESIIELFGLVTILAIHQRSSDLACSINGHTTLPHITTKSSTHVYKQNMENSLNFEGIVGYEVGFGG